MASTVASCRYEDERVQAKLFEDAGGDFLDWVETLRSEGDDEPPSVVLVTWDGMRSAEYSTLAHEMVGAKETRERFENLVPHLCLLDLGDTTAAATTAVGDGSSGRGGRGRVGRGRGRGRGRGGRAHGDGRARGRGRGRGRAHGREVGRVRGVGCQALRDVAVRLGAAVDEDEGRVSLIARMAELLVERGTTRGRDTLFGKNVAVPFQALMDWARKAAAYVAAGGDGDDLPEGWVANPSGDTSHHDFVPRRRIDAPLGGPSAALREACGYGAGDQPEKPTLSRTGKPEAGRPTIKSPTRLTNTRRDRHPLSTSLPHAHAPCPRLNPPAHSHGEAHHGHL